MRKSIFIFFALLLIPAFLLSCADGLKGSIETSTSQTPGSSSENGDSEKTKTTETSETDENDPFVGSTWVCDQSKTYATLIITIKFSTTGTVDYTINSAGRITSIYSGKYSVEKDFNGVKGQYGAQVGTQIFTIPSKNATTTTFQAQTFIKK